MTSMLVKLFIKNPEDVQNAAIRQKYGILSGAVGIVLNLTLTAIKFFAGYITGSISITSDAINNLSDAGSSIITILGFKISGRPADKNHPFGHGRIEYVSALIVSFIIMLLGFELLKESFNKIINPVHIEYSNIALGIMLFAILAKLWLALFNRSLGKKIHSPAMTAVVFDSLSDIAATSSTVLALIVSKYSDFSIDGYVGILVSCFIFYSGTKVLRETMAPLLGQPPSEELVKAIDDKITSYDGIVGVHDLIVHDYGPSRRFASAHAEVPANIDIMNSHDIVDLIERDIMKDMGILISIHLDPVIVDDERINELKEKVTEIAVNIDKDFSIHDFRVVEGPTHTNLIFDLVVPRNHKYDSTQLESMMEDALKKLDETYFCVVTVEHSFN